MNPERKRAHEARYRATKPFEAKARKRQYYYRNVEHERARTRRWYAKTWLTHSLRAAKKRAHAKGIPFDICIEDITVPTVCPILGIQLKLGARDGLEDASPTIDRVIQERGYVKGNVVVISHRANTIKNSGTAEEHKKISEWMKSFGGGGV